jgi:hypothetical protein
MGAEEWGQWADAVLEELLLEWGVLDKAEDGREGGDTDRVAVGEVDVANLTDDVGGGGELLGGARLEHALAGGGLDEGGGDVLDVGVEAVDLQTVGIAETIDCEGGVDKDCVASSHDRKGLGNEACDKAREGAAGIDTCFGTVWPMDGRGGAGEISGGLLGAVDVVVAEAAQLGHDEAAAASDGVGVVDPWSSRVRVRQVVATGGHDDVAIAHAVCGVTEGESGRTVVESVGNDDGELEAGVGNDVEERGRIEVVRGVHEESSVAKSEVRAGGMGVAAERDVVERAELGVPGGVSDSCER